MEGLLNFLADHYIWFAGISVFFAFALIGLVYETKKKKKAENKTADAVAQPNQQTPVAPVAAAAQNQGVVVANATEQQIVDGAPTLAGLESNTDNFSGSVVENAPTQTLVIDGSVAPTEAPAPSAEPTLVIEDPSAAPTETPATETQPTLVIEDNSAAPATAEAPAAQPEQTQTLGAPGQPPL